MKTMQEWQQKHILGMKDLSREEIETVLSLATSFKEISQREVKKVPALRGKTILNLFFENSTRTRTSFELAAKRLSADVVNFSASSSSLTKGETIIDTIKNLEAYHPDIMIIRIDSSASLPTLAKYTQASIVNAGDGKNEHPTQALLDMFTVKEIKGSLENLNVLIVGDIIHSRVARSNIWGLTKLGARVTVCAPKMLIPVAIEQMGVRVTHNLKEALSDSDAVNVLRMQFERDAKGAFPNRIEYFKNFGITKERLRQVRKDIVVMHPGPLNRGVEISSEVADGANSVILEQVTNGIAARMAVLFLVSQAQDKPDEHID